jgi:hypothetical protein
MPFKAGDTVECVERPGCLAAELTRGKKYVVCEVKLSEHDHEYLLILGDDERGHMLLSGMFRPVAVSPSCHDTAREG